MLKKLPFYILGVCVLALYAQTLDFGFTQIDDPKHIFENPSMIRPTWAGLWGYWIQPFFNLFIPVIYSLWMGISVFTHSPAAFHAFNLLLHAANACLVFVILQRITQEKLPSLAGAIVFAAHPAQVESVAWISGLKDVGFGFFALLTMEAYFRNWNRLKYVFLALAVLSKPTASIVPVLLFFIEVLWRPLPWKVALKKVAPMLLLAAPITLFTKFLQPDSDVQVLVDIPRRFLVAGDSIGFYLRQVFVPLTYSLDYGRSPDKVDWNSQFFLNAFVFLAVATLVYFAHKRFRGILLGFILFLVALAPTLGLVPFQFQVFSTVCDRYLYLPMFGMALVVAALFTRLQVRLQPLVASLILVLCVARAYPQVRVWASDEHLFKNALHHNPNSFLSHNNLAFWLYQAGRYHEAAFHFGKVTALKPEVAGLHSNLAAALMKIGNTQAAVEEFRKTLKLDPNHAQAREILAMYDKK